MRVYGFVEKHEKVLQKIAETLYQYLGWSWCWHKWHYFPTKDAGTFHCPFLYALYLRRNNRTIGFDRLISSWADQRLAYFIAKKMSKYKV